MPSRSVTTQVLSIVTFLLALSQPAHASVQTAAAIGIGVGLGVCLLAAIAGFSYLKYSRRACREREAAATAGPELSTDEIIAMHDRAAPKGFNIWEYDHKKHLARMRQVQEGEEEAVRQREDRGVEGWVGGAEDGTLFVKGSGLTLRKRDDELEYKPSYFAFYAFVQHGRTMENVYI
ncbi:hypothetical protein D0859_00081 [Hortaea werneckii]|uniref:Uncharacterized protein n=1 Tax=Hortaea werneckii TaxID=91943 RepID=A0A3M7JDA1_HORWE|nr:hypothetical protein D0859_00081 [Hortaea werneckii]